jgi:hypothetical protein
MRRSEKTEMTTAYPRLRLVPHHVRSDDYLVMSGDEQVGRIYKGRPRGGMALGDFPGALRRLGGPAAYRQDQFM